MENVAFALEARGCKTIAQKIRFLVKNRIVTANEFTARDEAQYYILFDDESAEMAAEAERIVAAIKEVSQP